jgi:uncharacterized damage-inducible protein DinB
MKKESFVSMMDDVERATVKLASLVPEDKLDVSPIPGSMTLRCLLFHLGLVGDTAQCQLSGQWKMEKPDWNLPKSMTKEKLIERIRAGYAGLRQCYAELPQGQFETRVTQTPWGAEGTIEELSFSVIYNHEIHHKMQLFMDLKALGIEVDTGTLYMGLDPGVVKT